MNKIEDNISNEDCIEKKVKLKHLLVILEDILLSEIEIYNKKALKLNFDNFKCNQDFSNLHLLEAGNEHLYEQFCFNNKLSIENRCKRLRSYNIHPDNSVLQEYKEKIEGGISVKNEELLYASLNDLLSEYELELGYSFNLTSVAIQNYLFTNTIILFKKDKKYDTKHKFLDLLFDSGLNLFVKQMLFNNDKVKKIYKTIYIKYKEFMDKVIERLNNIPYIEQKTDEWFVIRANMISASICGYIDGYVSGAGIAKEHEQIKEKCNLSKKKVFSMSSPPLKHGILFEDVTSDIYDSIYQLVSKEYGILTDYRHKCIGASPDGIIIDFKQSSNSNSNDNASDNDNDNASDNDNDNASDNDNIDVLNLFRYGRMREIKNPVSRNILNGEIPNYYYYQMQQQMYVCDLPFCDFIQTDITYPSSSLTIDKSRMSNFLNDKFDIDIISDVNNLNELKKYMANYILDNINWWSGIYNLNLMSNLLNKNIYKVNKFLLKLLFKHWDKFVGIPLDNIDSKGKVKGIFWYYTKGYNDDLEYKYTWTPLSSRINEDSIIKINNDVKQWEKEGYSLSDKYYFTINEFMNTEIPYNQLLYEDILKRLLKRWDTILELRNIPEFDKRLNRYNEIYPLDGNNLPFKNTFNSMTKDASDDIINLLGINYTNKKRKIKLKKKEKNIPVNVSSNDVFEYEL
jgi:hypothetical protein